MTAKAYDRKGHDLVLSDHDLTAVCIRCGVSITDEEIEDDAIPGPCKPSEPKEPDGD